MAWPDFSYDIYEDFEDALAGTWTETDPDTNINPLDNTAEKNGTYGLSIELNGATAGGEASYLGYQDTGYRNAASIGFWFYASALSADMNFGVFAHSESPTSMSQYVVNLNYQRTGGTGGPATYNATGCKFYNNLILKGRWGIVNESALNVTFKNNIVYVDDITASTTRFVTVYSGITGCVFDNNCYWGTADEWYWLGTAAATFANWKTTSSQDANGRNEDPDLAGYKITADSPCRDTGADLSGLGGLSYDKDRTVRPQEAGWDIGPYELDLSPGGSAAAALIGAGIFF
jgi:hypothetical protein